MKKYISVLFFLFIVFCISVNGFALNKPNKSFLTKEIDESTYTFAIDNGFDSIIFDTRKTTSISNIKISDNLSTYYLSTIDNLSLISEHVKSNNIVLYFPYGENIQDYITISNQYKIYGIVADIPISSYCDNKYEQYIQELKYSCNSLNLITLNRLDKILKPSVNYDFFGDTYEICNQYVINVLNDVAFCVNDYECLLSNYSGTTSALSSLFNSKSLEVSDGFKIKKRLEITRPTSSTLNVSTYKYTIFGTSDPSKPLYMNGELIDRISSTGLFAVTIDTSKKGKTYSFSQSGKTVSVTIKFSDEQTSGSGKINKITTCQPTSDSIAYCDKDYTISCIAPGNSQVSAYIGNKKISLKQISPSATGTPATFKGTINFNDDKLYPFDEVTSVGKIKYYLSYDGKTTSYESNGNLFVAGKNARVAIKAITDMAGVEIAPNEAGNFITTLRSGCCDYVKEDCDGWYKLSCDGYIPLKHCTFLTGKNNISNQLSDFSFEKKDNAEIITIKCTNIPAFIGDLEDYNLSLTLYNTESLKEEIKNSNSKLMHLIKSKSNNDGSSTLVFYSMKKLWGWDIFTDEENKTITIVLKEVPSLSNDTAKPLLGTTITVCAGHGGIDPGALSVAGEKGVNEFQINKANALAIKEMLESLGANVITILANDNDIKLDTYDRTNPARYAYSDLYICCHSNSCAENANANLYCGTEVYYHYNNTSDFSQKLVDYISLSTKRDNEGSIQDYYSVTRLTICPAVMLEVGFVSNPKELESLISAIDIEKTALAVTKAVIETLDN